MQTDPAETRGPESAVKIAVSVDKSAAMIDRRISVAPMMEWTDCRRSRFSIKALGRWCAPCLLYVSSNAKILPAAPRSVGGPPGGRGEHESDRARRSNAFLLRWREATFPFS